MDTRTINDPVQPWVDASEIDRLARLLMAPVPAPPEAPDHTGFDDQFVGFSADSPTLPPDRFELGDRLDRFQDWLRRQFSCVGLFLLDAAGTPVGDHPAYPAYHATALQLARAAENPAAPVRHIHLRVAPALFLEVLPVESTSGTLILGLVVTRPFGPAAVETLAAALRNRTFEATS